jgi:hypothetical protein
LNHVTLKSEMPGDFSVHRWTKVRSGPSVNHVREPWDCGLCASYASLTNTYRVIDKNCSDHACLIPKD